MTANEVAVMTFHLTARLEFKDEIPFCWEATTNEKISLTGYIATAEQ